MAYKKRSSFQLDVNTSELDRVLINLKSVCTERQFKAICREAFGRSSGHVRAIVQKDLPKEYHGPVRWMTRAVRNGRMSESKGEVSFRIPVRGYRGIIGAGGEFAASATGADGKNLLTKRSQRLYKRATKASLRRQKITAQILKGKTSVLPSTNEEVAEARRKAASGGSPHTVAQHFVMRGGKHAGEIWARDGKGIRPATGIGVPQMPLNRSEEDLKRDLSQYLEKRVVDNYFRVMTGKWKV